MSDTINLQVEELFKIGAHLGHKTNRVHPKAKKYIYTIENGVSIIDLTKTVTLLDQALAFAAKLGKENKTLLVVMTKRAASRFTQEICEKNGLPSVTVKWPAGLLTNFEMIMKNVKKLIAMKEEKEKGEWNKFVKHEQMKLAKDLRKLERFYEGLISLTRKPDALFVVDIKKEKNAVKEAVVNKIPLIAVVDTNVNPDDINYPIPANDDSMPSIEFFITKVIETYTNNKIKTQNSKIKA